VKFFLQLLQWGLRIHRHLGVERYPHVYRSFDSPGRVNQNHAAERQAAPRYTMDRHWSEIGELCGVFKNAGYAQNTLPENNEIVRFPLRPFPFIQQNTSQCRGGMANRQRHRGAANTTDFLFPGQIPYQGGDSTGQYSQVRGPIFRIRSVAMIHAVRPFSGSFPRICVIIPRPMVRA